MESLHLMERRLLFLLGCIPLRVALAYYVLGKPSEYMYVILASIGMGFLYIYLTNSRKTGVEVFGGKIWWNNLRPIHGVLYLVAAYYLWKGENKISATILTLDVVIGLSSFMLFHLQQK